MAWPVLLYVPNLIGYGRIGLALVAFWNVQDPKLFVTLYAAGFLLDAADGYAARLLKQSSEFGAMMDMLTDRFSTSGLLLLLARRHVSQVPSTSAGASSCLRAGLAVALCLFLALLDAVSHFWQVCAASMTQASSHKAAGAKRLVRLYYRRSILTAVCLFSEMFLLLHFFWGATQAGSLGSGYRFGLAMKTVYVGCGAVYVLKQCISLAQISNAVTLLSQSVRTKEEDATR